MLIINQVLALHPNITIIDSSYTYGGYINAAHSGSSEWETRKNLLNVYHN